MTAKVRFPRNRGGLPSALLKKRLHSRLAEDLGRAIVQGRYCEGDPLPGEIEFSQALGVSRGAYRETLRSLASKGLIESRQKAGTIVLPRSEWNILDRDVLRWLLGEGADGVLSSLLEMRLVLEPAAAALAARRRTDEQLTEMEAAFAQIIAAGQDKEMSARAHDTFYATIASAAQNDILQKVAALIRDELRSIATTEAISPQFRSSLRHDKLLLAAIRDRDSQLAGAQCLQSLRASEARPPEEYESFGAESDL